MKWGEGGIDLNFFVNNSYENLNKCSLLFYISWPTSYAP
jgi:hypothetical protein